MRAATFTIFRLNTARRLGITQTLLSGVCFGTLGLFGKIAFARGLTPTEFLSLRFLLGGLMLVAFVAVTHPRSLKLSLREILLCAMLGVFGYALFSSCFFQALRGLSASLTVLLLYTYPILVTAGAWVFFGESVPPNKWLSLPLAMLGLALLIWGEFQILDNSALAFGFAAAVFYAAYILVSSRSLKTTDPFAAVTYIQIFAGLALTLFHEQSAAWYPTVIIENAELLLGTALIGSAMAMSLFLAGLRHLKAWEVSILSTAEPLTGILLATCLLHEPFTKIQLVGACLVLLAFLWVSKPKTG